MSEETFQRVAYDAIRIMSSVGFNTNNDDLKKYATLLQTRYERLLTDGDLQ
jgi:hypothetical protein